jgi:hypothetical protein
MQNNREFNSDRPGRLNAVRDFLGRTAHLMLLAVGLIIVVPVATAGGFIVSAVVLVLAMLPESRTPR